MNKRLTATVLLIAAALAIGLFALLSRAPTSTSRSDEPASAGETGSARAAKPRVRHPTSETPVHDAVVAESEPGAAVTGIVRIDGVPSAGLDVWLALAPSSAGMVPSRAADHTVSGADGRFEFSVPAHDATFVASRSPRTTLVAVPVPAADADGYRAEVALDLTTGATLTGSVTDADGKPLPGVAVTVWRGDGDRTMAAGDALPGPSLTLASFGRAVTDASGSFVVSGLRAGLSHRVSIARLGYTLDFTRPQPGVFQPLSVPSPPVAYTMDGTLAARVEIFAGDGDHPVPDCCVEVVGSRGIAPIAAELASGPDGERDSTRGDQLAHGFFVLRARRTDRSAEDAGVRVVVSALGFESKALDVDLAPSVAQDATDVKPVIVRMRQTAATFGGLRLRIQLPERVSPRRMGFPVRIAHDGRTTELWHTGVVGGEVVLTRVPAGTLAVSPPQGRSPPALDWSPFTVEVVGGEETVHDLPVWISPSAGFIVVSARDAGGAPLDGFLIRARMGATTMSGAPTAESGDTLFVSAAPGSWTLTVSRPGFEDATVTVDVEGGHVVEAPVTLTRAPR